MASYSTKGIKQPRTVTFRGVTYPSINAFTKWAISQGYKTDFGTIRSGLDHNRDLEEVLAGKTFDRMTKYSVTYQGVTYASSQALYREICKKHKKVYLGPASFREWINKEDVETAVYRLLHPRITNCSISRKLGGPNNLVLLRIKNGWDPYRAMHTRCQHKRSFNSR